jgi:thiol-disulfide isomerase/thioredoxin
MDRLSTLSFAAAALLLSWGCADDTPKGAPPSRVNAVAAVAEKVDLESFCDVRGDKAFAYPDLAARPPAAAAGRWRWINLWATWCKPCIVELPLVTQWTRQLDADLVLISFDVDDASVAAFQKEHAEVTGSLRVADLDRAKTWLTTLGLDSGAPIPIHIFVDPSNTTRCIRAGAINRTDHDTVKALLSSR